MRSNRHSDSYSSDAPTNLPLWLLALAMLVWLSYQLSQAMTAHDALTQAFAAQESELESAKQIKQTLFGLATATKRLAQQGNPNAAQVVNGLASRGINIEDPQPGQVQQTLQ